MASSGFRRKSRANTRSRRSQWKARMPQLDRCGNPDCRRPKVRHTVCPACGRYGDRQVLPPRD